LAHYGPPITKTPTTESTIVGAIKTVEFIQQVLLRPTIRNEKTLFAQHYKLWSNLLAKYDILEPSAEDNTRLSR